MVAACPKCFSNDTTLIKNEYVDEHHVEVSEYFIKCLNPMCMYDEQKESNDGI